MAPSEPSSAATGTSDRASNAKPPHGDVNDPDDSPPPSIVLGTAGHIDHGKTALVRALTGRDLDQLPEEKARGITIELGFAPLELEEGMRVAVVDVPGHERFVRTMVSGASGLDLVMLVVAADEGVMPQTREHLAICELLGVDRGLVVLTKTDLVDEEMVELAGEEVRDLLEGSALAEIPILPASAETGEGIDAVRACLIDLVRTRPERSDDGRPARLFVDRSFTRHGFGTVVTGTWSGRARKLGDAIVLEPGARKARIRGLERHGDSIEVTESGARIAVNLQGIDHDEIHRGDLLTEPGALEPTATFDASLRWLGRQEASDQPTSVELLTGTTERRARVAPIGDEPLLPGARGFARVHVDGDPLALLPGDRFVIRGFARDAGVGATLGGGVVLDTCPPRRRRRDKGLHADLVELSSGSTRAALAVRILRAGLSGTTVSRLAIETGYAAARLDADLDALETEGLIARLDRETCLPAAGAERLMQALTTTLGAFHAEQPLKAGLSRAALLASLPENVSSEAASVLLERLHAANRVVIEEQTVALEGHRPEADASQQVVIEKIRVRYAEAGLEAPTSRTLAEDLGLPERELRELAHFLEREAILIAAPDELFFDRNAVIDLIERVVAHFEAQDELDTQTLKALIGTSRRTAMPLMALLDDLQITRRDGSLRRLMNKTPKW